MTNCVRIAWSKRLQEFSGSKIPLKMKGKELPSYKMSSRQSQSRAAHHSFLALRASPTVAVKNARAVKVGFGGRGKRSRAREKAAGRALVLARGVRCAL